MGPGKRACPASQLAATRLIWYSSVQELDELADGCGKAVTSEDGKRREKGQIC